MDMKSNKVMVPIKKSTADAVIEALYKDDTEGLLLRFDAVKAAANEVDAERDRLRKYIQDNVAVGRHGRVILTKTPGTAVMYPNADGKDCLEVCLIIRGPKPMAEETDVAVYLERITADRVLHELQKGKEHLEEYLENAFHGQGTTVDNFGLYTYSEPLKVNLTVIPEVPDEPTA